MVLAYIAIIYIYIYIYIVDGKDLENCFYRAYGAETA